MPSVGVRELKNGLSKYLKRLKPGQVLTVTDRGRAIAEIHPVASNTGAPMDLTGRFDALVRAGIVRPPLERGDPLAGWPSDRDLRLKPGSARTLLDADRRDTP